MSGTIFIDGGPPRGLPVAPTVSSSDGIVVAQGGSPGIPGSATIREATVAQLLATATPFLPLTGGTLTGPLILNANPSAALGAATKQYADQFLPLAGGAIAGTLSVAGVLTAPTAVLGTNTTQAATTAFVNGSIAAAVLSPSLAPGSLFGMTLANDGGTPATVLDVAAGSCSDSTNAVGITLGAFTKSIAGNWVAGTGNNGMGVGLTATLSTWYHVFAIVNTGVADVYFDTSVTAANKPVGTTALRRLGSFLLDGAVHIIPFSQNNDEFLWKASANDLSGVVLPTANRTLYVISVPLGVKVNALVTAQAFATPGNGQILFTSPDQTDQVVGVFGPSSLIAAPTVSAGTVVNVRTNTSSQVGIRAQTANTIITGYTYGWIDTRGRLS